jgi:hypothetical protein
VTGEESSPARRRRRGTGKLTDKYRMIAMKEDTFSRGEK